MRYDLIRLVLLQRPQIDMFGSREISREDWLRTRFSERIDFTHRKIRFSYVPTPQDSRPDSRMITGFVGRLRAVKENKSPDEALEPMEREQWKAATIILDPKSHDDGQKAAVENDPTVGTPLSLLQSLAAAINLAHPEAPYTVEANSIIDTDSFYKFLSDNEGEVTTITFELLAPNMFGIRRDLDREMRDFRDKEKVKKLKVTLASDDGLQAQTERVKETAEYAAEGGGSIRAKTKKGKKYNSKNRTKAVTVTPPEAEIPALRDRLTRLISAVFK